MPNLFLIFFFVELVVPSAYPLMAIAEPSKGPQKYMEEGISTVHEMQDELEKVRKFFKITF